MNKHGITDLHLAACEGNLSWVHDCLRCGDDVDVGDKYGNTPLHWASDMAMVEGEREPVVAALINAGADVNAKRDGGESVLMVACIAGNRDVVRQLLAAGADILARNDKEETALGYAGDALIRALLAPTSPDAD